MTIRPLYWVGSSRRDVRRFSRKARRIVGVELWRVQSGLEPRDWRPMPAIGLGVREIRIHSELEYRAVYVARFAEAVYVLHVFDKRSRRTARRDIELATARMHELQMIRSLRK